MFNKKNINNYKKNEKTVVFKNKAEDEFARTAVETTKTVSGMILKLLFTLFCILSIAGSIVMVSALSYIWSLRNQEVPALESIYLNESSYIYRYDDEGNELKYMVLHSTENRTKVDFADIPQYMKDAQVAIEDERFWTHNGVDWYNTLGAVFTLLTGSSDGRGGSTITQQLVKNITGRNDVSVTRKITEIFAAINLSKQYSRDQILEYYLNVVYYGYGTQGVQAASTLYFGHPIQEASLAECAMIAGITQNPSAFTPIYYPENAESKQRLVLLKMYELGKITREEYDEACEESYNMNYAFKSSSTGEKDENKPVDSSSIWNWYIDTMFNDLVTDLSKELNISRANAADQIYNGGLRIYTAMDLDIQKDVEKLVMDSHEYIDPDLQVGFYMMDYDGRVLGIAGSAFEKTVNRGTNWATGTMRSPGSSIKALSVYTPAIDLGVITYGTMLNDQAIKDFYGEGTYGPNNYIAGQFLGYIPTEYAVEISQNAPAARVLQMVGTSNAFDYITQKLHITTLDPVGDANPAPLSIGGTTHGVNVDEMTAAFQVFGNGGEYNKPYTYYYVEQDNEIILDNRHNTPEKVMNEVNANIMNKLLQNVVYGSNGTARQVQISGMPIFGKTGTSEEIRDLWFVGGTPYAVAGIWVGYDPMMYTGKTSIRDESSHKKLWKNIMQNMWDKYWSQGDKRSFEYSSDLVELQYCTDSGLIASAGCNHTKTGYYDKHNIPQYCNSTTDHTKYYNTPVATKKPTPMPTFTVPLNNAQ